MEEQKPRDEVRFPVVRDEDLSEWMNKEDVTPGGIKVIIKDVFGGETKYGFRYKLCTGRGDITLNKTSLKKIVTTYGANTQTWVDKPVKVTKIQMMVSGEMKDVLIVEPTE